MKKLKLVILSCGVLGLVALVAPLSGRSLLMAYVAADPVSAVVFAASFLLPAATATLALVRPPMRAWQPGVALAGFVLGLVRLRIWDLALNLGSAGAQGVLLVIAIVVGTAASVTALLRPEEL